MIPPKCSALHPAGTICRRPSVEEVGLRPAASAERGGRELREASLPHAGPAAAYGEELGDVPGEEPLAPHPRSEAGVVELAAAHRTDAVQHLLFPFGEVAGQPVLEERSYGVREPHGDVGGKARAGLGCGGEERRQLVVIEAGDHRRGHHPNRDADYRELLDGGEPARGAGGPRLHDASQAVVQGGERDGYRGGVVAGELGEEVYVASDEVVLRDDGDRVPELREYLETAARDPEPPLDGLVGVGDAAHGEHLRLPARRRKLFSQQFGGAFFDQDLALEVQARREAEVLVGGTSVAVGASMIASAIGIDARVEADVRAVVASHDRARVITQVNGLRVEFLRVHVAGVWLDLDPLEAVLRVGSRPATDDAPPRPLPLLHPPILTAKGTDPTARFLRGGRKG